MTGDVRPVPSLVRRRAGLPVTRWTGDRGAFRAWMVESGIPGDLVQFLLGTDAASTWSFELCGWRNCKVGTLFVWEHDDLVPLTDVEFLEQFEPL